MKYYLIAGEASGDLHGANLMRAIREIDTDSQFRFWGGDAMSEIGGMPVRHIKDLAFMGFVEVIGHLNTILNNIEFCKKDILQYGPDVVVGIDYPGFNLKIENWAHANGIHTVHYISPNLWAWKKGRIHKMILLKRNQAVAVPLHLVQVLLIGLVQSPASFTGQVVNGVKKLHLKIKVQF